MPRDVLRGGVLIRGVPDNVTDADIEARFGQTDAGGYAMGKPRDLAQLDQSAVQGVANDLNPVERLLIGIREPVRAAGARLEAAAGMPGAYEEYKREAPMVSQVPGVLPAVGQTIASMGTAAIPGGIFSQILAQGAVGGMTARPGQESSGAMWGMLGELGGQALGRGYGVLQQMKRGTGAPTFARRVVRGADAGADAVREAQDLGFVLTPGQASGSGPERLLDATVSRQFPTRGVYERAANYNRDLLNNYGAKALGSTASDLGDVTRGRIADDLGKEFRAVAQQGSSMSVDEIDNILGTARRAFPDVWSGPSGAQLADQIMGSMAHSGRIGTVRDPSGAITRATDVLSPDELMGLRERVSKMARQAWRTGADHTGEALSSVLDEIDNGLTAGLPLGGKRRYAQAREQWRNLIALERPGVLTTEGNINPQAAMRSYEQVFGTAATRDGPGRGALAPATQHMIRANRALQAQRMRPIVGTSGTAEQASLAAMVAGLVSNPIPTLAAAGGARAAAELMMMPEGIGRELGALGSGVLRAENQQPVGQ